VLFLATGADSALADDPFSTDLRTNNVLQASFGNVFSISEKYAFSNPVRTFTEQNKNSHFTGRSHSRSALIGNVSFFGFNFGNQINEFFSNLRLGSWNDILRPSYTVEGVVKDRSDVPISDTNVFVEGGKIENRKVTTNEKGEWKVDDVSGEVTIRAVHPDYTFPSSPRTVENSADLVFVGKLTPFDVSGTVRSAKDNAIQDAQLVAKGEDTETQRVKSNEEGAWQFKNLKGDVTIEVSHDKFEFNISTKQVSQEKQLSFIGRRLYAVNGQVLDQQNKGIEGAQISLNGEYITDQQITTGEEGKWSADNLQGEVTVSVESENYSFSTAQKTVSADNAGKVTFTGRELYTLSGTVKKANNGKGIEDARVVFEGPDVTSSEVVTNKEGQWEKANLKGEVTVSVEHEDYVFSNPVRTFTEQNRDIQFTVNSSYEISGRVLDQGNGPVYNAQISLTGENIEDRQVATDRGGSWSVSDLIGEVTITLDHEQYEFPDNEQVVNEADNTIRFTGQEIYRASGDVVNQQGEGIAGADISLRGDNIENSVVSTDEQGKWKQENLQGEVEVEVSKEGYSFSSTTQTVTGAQGDIRFTGREIYAANGMVQAEDGSPIEGANIELSGEKIDGPITVTTNAEGTWSKSGLKGTVNVSVANGEYVFEDANKIVTKEHTSADFEGVREFTVTGIVRTRQGTPLRGAEITLSGSEIQTHAITTGEQGKWKKPGLKGEVNITVAHENYEFESPQRTIQESTYDLSFEGERLYSASGTVLQVEGNRPLSGVEVNIVGENNRSTQTNEQGQWSIENLTGTTRISVSHPHFSFTPQTRKINEEAEGLDFQGKFKVPSNFFITGHTAGNLSVLDRSGEVYSNYPSLNSYIEGLTVDNKKNIYTGTGEVSKISPAGEIKWEYGGHSGQVTALTTKGKYVYSADSQGNIHKISKANGEQQWTLEAHSSDIYVLEVDQQGNIYSGGGRELKKHHGGSAPSIAWTYNQYEYESAVRALDIDAEGRVYSGTYEGEVHRISKYGVKEIEYETGHRWEIRGLVVNAAGELFVAQGDKIMKFRLNSSDNVEWTYAEHSTEIDDLTLAGNHTLYSVVDGTIHAIDLTNGAPNKAWEHSLQAEQGIYHIDAAAYPSIQQHKRPYKRFATVGTVESVHQVSAGNEQGWNFHGGVSLRDGALTSGENGNIFIASDSSGVFKVGREGHVKWNSDPKEGGITMTTIEKDINNNVYVGDSQGTMYKFNGATGEKIWEESVGSLVVQDIAVTGNDKLYYTIADNRNNKDKKVFKVDANSPGDVEWSYEHDFAVSSLAVNDNGAVFSGGYAGQVHKLTLEGEYAWNENNLNSGHGAAITDIAVGSEGNVYTVGKDNNLEKVEDQGDDPEEVWTYGGHSNTINGVDIDNRGKIYTVSDTSLHKIREENGSPTQEWTRSISSEAKSVVATPPIALTAFKNSDYEVSGTVQDQQGHSISGAEISFSGEEIENVESVSTDENGNWSKEGLVGSVTVSVSHNDYTFTPPEKTVSSATNTLNFEGTVPSYAVSGTVLESDGTPIRGAEISFTGEELDRELLVRSSEDGSWRKDELQGSVEVSVSHPDYSFGDSTREITESREGITFTGSLESYTVSGRVMTSQGEDVESAEVQFYGSNIEDGQTVTTNANGEWSKDGLQGTVSVEATHPHYSFVDRQETVTEARDDLTFRVFENADVRINDFSANNEQVSINLENRGGTEATKQIYLQNLEGETVAEANITLSSGEAQEITFDGSRRSNSLESWNIDWQNVAMFTGNASYAEEDAFITLRDVGASDVYVDNTQLRGMDITECNDAISNLIPNCTPRTLELELVNDGLTSQEVSVQFEAWRAGGLEPVHSTRVTVPGGESSESRRQELSFTAADIADGFRLDSVDRSSLSIEHTGEQPTLRIVEEEIAEISLSDYTVTLANNQDCTADQYFDGGNNCNDSSVDLQFVNSGTTQGEVAIQFRNRSGNVVHEEVRDVSSEGEVPVSIYESDIQANNYTLLGVSVSEPRRRSGTGNTQYTLTVEEGPPPSNEVMMSEEYPERAELSLKEHSMTPEGPSGPYTVSITVENASSDEEGLSGNVQVIYEDRTHGRDNAIALSDPLQSANLGPGDEEHWELSADQVNALPNNLGREPVFNDSVRATQLGNTLRVYITRQSNFERGDRISVDDCVYDTLQSDHICGVVTTTGIPVYVYAHPDQGIHMICSPAIEVLKNEIDIDDWGDLENSDEANCLNMNDEVNDEIKAFFEGMLLGEAGGGVEVSSSDNPLADSPICEHPNSRAAQCSDSDWQNIYSAYTNYFSYFVGGVIGGEIPGLGTIFDVRDLWVNIVNDDVEGVGMSLIAFIPLAGSIGDAGGMADEFFSSADSADDLRISKAPVKWFSRYLSELALRVTDRVADDITNDQDTLLAANLILYVWNSVLSEDTKQQIRTALDNVGENGEDEMSQNFVNRRLIQIIVETIDSDSHDTDYAAQDCLQSSVQTPCNPF